MTLRYALLAILADKPASGFDVLRRFRATAGYAWHAHHSQIYPELARCLEEGLIEEIGRGPRSKRVYRTTRKGLQAVRKWLLSTEPDRVVRNEATLRSFFTWLIPPAAAEEFYRNEAAYHRAQLDELEVIRQEFPADWRNKPVNVSGRITLEMGLRYERMLAEWADWAADQIALSRLRESDADASGATKERAAR